MAEAAAEIQVGSFMRTPVEDESQVYACAGLLS
jgi:hypothetical protein